MVLMAVADATYALCTLTLAVKKKDSDSTSFKQLTLHTSIQIWWNYPVRDLLQKQRSKCVFAGDEGFALNRNIL